MNFYNQVAYSFSSHTFHNNNRNEHPRFFSFILLKMRKIVVQAYLHKKTAILQIAVAKRLYHGLFRKKL